MAATLPVDSDWTRKTMRLCCLSSRCPLVLLLRQLVGCIIISRRPLAAPPSRPLIVPAIFASPSPCRSSSPTPSNAFERCCCHRTPPPLPPLNAVSIVHCCHSCRPSPPSNANAHLRPSPSSNADARRHHLPPLMSISIIASPSPIHSPYRRRRPPSNAAAAIERRLHCSRPLPLPPPPGLLTTSPSSIDEERGSSTTQKRYWFRRTIPLLSPRAPPPASPCFAPPRLTLFVPPRFAHPAPPDCFGLIVLD